MVPTEIASATRWLTVLLGVWLAGTSTAAAFDETLEKNYAEKLEKPFVSTISWESSLAKARQLSAEKNLPIIAYFTRSYAP